MGSRGLALGTEKARLLYYYNAVELPPFKLVQNMHKNTCKNILNDILVKCCHEKGNSNEVDPFNVYISI